MTDARTASDLSLASRVQQEVERLIATGALQAGERISEQSIAQRLGFSRGPVREAFRALTEAGLLVSERNRGVQVRTIGTAELLDLYEVRAALEGQIAAAALPHLTPETFAAFELVLRDMQAAIKDGAPQDYFAANVQFDAILIAACPNRPLREVYRSITRKMQLVRRRRLQGIEEMAQSCANHAALLDVLRWGDAAEVRRAFHDAIMRSRAAIAAEAQSPSSASSA